jgi:hypothetical protein
MITRISKIKGFGNIIGGCDLANIFKDGHVYSVTKIDGTILIDDLGEHALMEKHNLQKFSIIMMKGAYLLTKKEYAAELKKKDLEE